VLVAAHRLAAEGKLDLDAPVKVENHFASLVDGSPFVVDPKDDTDDWVYRQIGRAVPLRKLLERMIVRSSNLATNLVMQRVPASAVRAACLSVGAEGMNVLRGVEDQKAHDKGLDNTTTAHALAKLLEAAAELPAVVDVLAAQQLNEGIPAALPPGTRVAHKTGSITRHYHDAALVYPGGAARRPYVLVVLTKGFEKEDEAIALVKAVSRKVWVHVLDAGRQSH